MHISDGIISAPVCIAAHLVALGAVVVAGRNSTPDEIPKMGITGAALFVASLLHLPVAGTSLHPGLFGIAGVILGRRSFPVIYTALLFQSLAFQHGGLLTLGVNSINMAAGAYAAWAVWSIKGLPVSVRALVAGFAGVMLPALLMVVSFRVSGYPAQVGYLLVAYLVAASAEAVLTLFMVSFFLKVKPSVLAGGPEH